MVWKCDLNQHMFYDFISSFTPQFQFRLRRYIKHSRQCFITFPNSLNFVKNSALRVVFSTFFSLFGNMMKHCLSCLIYYLKLSKACPAKNETFGIIHTVSRETVCVQQVTKLLGENTLISQTFFVILSLQCKKSIRLDGFTLSRDQKQGKPLFKLKTFFLNPIRNRESLFRKPLLIRIFSLEPYWKQGNLILQTTFKIRNFCRNPIRNRCTF